MSDAVTRCYPDFQRTMRRGENLTGILQMFSSDRELSVKCSRFNSVLNCIDGSMRGCARESDSYDSVAIYWKRKSEGMQDICHVRRREFLEAQHCMSSYDLLREARECDSRTEYNWERSQSRRSCHDYESEVTCADRVIHGHCDERTARMIGQITRQFLKNSPETSNCFEPAYSGSSQAVSSLSALVVALGLRLIIYQVL